MLLNILRSKAMVDRKRLSKIDKELHGRWYLTVAGSSKNSRVSSYAKALGTNPSVFLMYVMPTDSIANIYAKILISLSVIDRLGLITIDEYDRAYDALRRAVILNSRIEPLHNVYRFVDDSYINNFLI